MRDSRRSRATTAGPPSIARVLLRLIAPPRLRGDVIEDLDEEFVALLVEGRGRRQARRWYWGQVLGSIEPLLRARWRSRGDQARTRFSERASEMMSAIAQDLKYGARMLLRSPIFTSVAVLTLALGVGATTAIFSVVDGVVLRPLPFEDPGRLVRITVKTRGPNWMGTSEPEYVDVREQIDAFEAAAAYDTWTLTLGDSIEPRRFRAITATAELFPMLGVQPLLGRWFTPEEDRPGVDLVGVLSYGMWRRDFGGRADILGETIYVNEGPVTVIGVMPPEFVFPTPEYEMWAPQRLDLADLWARNNHYLGVVARLLPGITPDQAQAELDVLAASSETEYPEFYGESGYRIRLQGLRDSMVSDVKTMLFLLLASVGFVLLIVCVNVANLLLARGETRKREIAVRAALGAGRRRLGRQLLTESGLLAVAGGLAGLVLAYVGGGPLLALAPDSIPRLESVTIDLRVLGVALATVLATGLLFGVAPAIHGVRADVGEVLKGGGRTATRGRKGRLVRRMLVVGQLAMAVLLLLGAGIALRSFANLYRVDPGVQTEGVLTLRVSPLRSRVPDAVTTVQYHRELVERLAGLPGVEAGGAVARLPLASGANNWSFQIEGREVESVGEAPAANVQQATPGYFQAVGLGLVRGRLFDHRDHAESTPVVIINERLAREHWPNEDPLGKRMRVFLEGWPWMEIVGIVRDVRHFGLDVEVPAKWYVPHAQAYASAYASPRSMTLVLRTETAPRSLIAPARAAIRDFDPTVPISDVRTMREVVSASVGDRRFTMLLLASFALVALFLAAIGAYGVISYGVSQRTQEIGVRMALGARADELLRQVIREGLVLALTGVAIGAAAGMAMSRVFDSLVFGISPTDPLTYVGVVALIVFTALVASYLPARRASGVDPVVSLRSGQE